MWMMVSIFFEMRKTYTYIIVILCLVTSNVFSQSDTVYQQSTDAKKINVPGLITVGAITPCALAGVYVYMNNVWWSKRSSGFHFDGGTDLKYARNLDKIGHFTASCLVSTAFSDLLRVCGVSEKWAVWGGAGLSSINATVIEIKDGYAPFWGFSIYDEMANILGAFYPVLQTKVPFFRNFSFKWSYDWNYSYETEYYKYKTNALSKSAYSFIDDYDRQYFWLTVDWAHLFCKNKPKYKFPYFIDVALGVSAENLKENGSNTSGKAEFYFGLDINLTKFFQQRNVGYYICKYVNFYHLPMPAVRVAPDLKAYPINW